MTALDRTFPLTRCSVQSAHEKIREHIHLTPVFTSTTLSDLASTPQTPEALVGTPWEGQRPAHPKINFFFKCENYQRIGAFKIRGAFHALSRLTKEELARGVVTHSSGNHAQALALAARTYKIPAHIVMPTISTPSKIAATKGYGAHVYFSGSTSDEREAVVKDVIAETGAVLVPPYDHPDVILGQGTMALELEAQVREMVEKNPQLSVHHSTHNNDVPLNSHTKGVSDSAETQNGHKGKKKKQPGQLDAVIAPLGGGGMLSGIATALSTTPTLVFGAEPSFQGADDGRRSLETGTLITKVSSLTIADGLRTPVGQIPWSVISDKEKVEGVFAVSEEQILQALRLVLERMKCVVEPSCVVGLAVALWDEGFRRLVGEEGWDVGIVFSGGNTSVEALGQMFAVGGERGERMEGKVGKDGERVAENVAG